MEHEHHGYESQGDKVLCLCCNVTEGKILKAIENGADSLEAVRKAVRYGYSCGMCTAGIEGYIARELASRRTGKTSPSRIGVEDAP